MVDKTPMCDPSPTADVAITWLLLGSLVVLESLEFDEGLTLTNLALFWLLIERLSCYSGTGIGM